MSPVCFIVALLTAVAMGELGLALSSGVNSPRSPSFPLRSHAVVQLALTDESSNIGGSRRPIGAAEATVGTNISVFKLAVWSPHTHDVTIIDMGDNSSTDIVPPPPAKEGIVAAQIQYIQAFNLSGWDHVVLRTLTYGQRKPGDGGVTQGIVDGDERGLHDTTRYYAAGLLEGYTTQETIYFNYLVSVPPVVNNFNTTAHYNRFMAFVQNHYDYLTEKGSKFDPSIVTAESTNATIQVGLYMNHLQGLYDGYMRRWLERGSPVAEQLTLLDMFMVNLQPELGDIVTATSTPSSMRGIQGGEGDDFRSTASLDINKQRVDHCSALIRPTHDDLYLAHATWSGYNTMFRQYKTYNFTAWFTPSFAISQSSYPGCQSSTDDWYITWPHRLAVTETTINVFNNTLYQLYTVPRTISEYLRVMTATALASTGAEWMAIFETENSGTYCNEWMVVDMKLYGSGGGVGMGALTTAVGSTGVGDAREEVLLFNETMIPNGTLWVADQLPGSVVKADLSHVLREKGYFGSYNIPYFPSVFNISGNNVAEALWGAGVAGYRHYARAEIFARDAPNAQSRDDVRRLMRRNEYQTDPMAIIPNCTGANLTVTENVCDPVWSPWLAIAARGDLVPYQANASMYVRQYGQGWTFYAPTQAYGAIDAKVASWSASFPSNGTLFGWIVAGPSTNEGLLPPFRWSEFDGILSPPPLGQPDLFDFPWLLASSSGLSTQAPLAGTWQTAPTNNALARKVTIAVSIIVALVIIVSIGLILFRSKERAAAVGGSDRGAKVSLLNSASASAAAA